MTLRRSWIWLAVFIVAIEVLALAPLVLNRHLARAGDYSAPILLPIGSDTFVYENYLLQTSDGFIALRDRMTAEPQIIGIVNPFWFIVGRLGAVFELTPFQTFHTARLFFLPLLVLTVFFLAGKLFQPSGERLLATVVICGAGGLGYFTVLFAKELPPDFVRQIGTIFNQIFASPHVPAGTILLIMVHWLTFQALERRCVPELIGAALLGSLLLWFQPYFWLALLIPAVGWFVYRRNYTDRTELLNFIIFQGALLLAVFYHALTIVFDPFTAARYASNVTLSASILEMTLSFGVLFILAAVGFRTRFSDNSFWRYLLIWLISSWLLLFAPIQTNIRFIQGLMVPLGLAVSAGFIEIIRRVRRGQPRYWFSPVGVALSLGAIIFLGSMVGAATVILETARAPQFPESFGRVVRALQNEPVGVIFSDPNVALILIGRTRHRAYAAHWSETVALKEKTLVIEGVFSSKNEGSVLVSKLRALGIDYLVTYPGSKIATQELSAIVSVKSINDYGLYRVP